MEHITPRTHLLDTNVDASQICVILAQGHTNLCLLQFWRMFLVCMKPALSSLSWLDVPQFCPPCGWAFRLLAGFDYDKRDPNQGERNKVPCAQNLETLTLSVVQLFL